MVILGVVFIIIFFIILSLFPYVMSFSPSFLEFWVYLLLILFVLELGFFSIFEVKIKQAIVVFLVISLWSLGFFVLPTPPEGYGEVEQGGWFLLLCLAVYVYAKIFEPKKKKR